ncbi:MAG: prepilin-type N-terminal cleavage/methylation domain-containing protein [Candidatus Omnitrophica bacterium]|nr:prepilin-type N-terminal cleavage/methylation domain-containing protein [Candidatus Omnitrophota bacterium]
MNRKLISHGLLITPKNKAFTLLELIIVIIIIGILATVGLSQYTIIIEKGRLGEAKSNLGVMRKLAYEYYLRNGTFSGMVSNDVLASLPTGCTSTNYFFYARSTIGTNWVDLGTYRCTTGGKTPNAPYYYRLFYRFYPETSGSTYICECDNTDYCPCR